MNFFKEHLPGCTPLKPCKNCEVVLFLKSRLTAENLATLSEMMEGGVTLAKVYKDASLNEPISVLGLTVRAANCLKAERIDTLRDLVTKTEIDLIKIPNLGRKALKEIKEALAYKKGLTLGMKPELA